MNLELAVNVELCISYEKAHIAGAVERVVEPVSKLDEFGSGTNGPYGLPAVRDLDEVVLDLGALLQLSRINKIGGTELLRP